MTILRLEPLGPDEVCDTAALVLHVAKSGGSGSYIDLVGEYRDEYVRACRTPSGARRWFVTLKRPSACRLPQRRLGWLANLRVVRGKRGRS